MNRETKRIALDNGVALVSVLGDITEEHVDAIVNAANSRLLHGGGVAGHIARRGGPTIQEESHKAAPVRTGSAAITSAGKLPCKWVIHAVGPVWTGGANDEETLLKSAVVASLALASSKGCKSLSIPSISAGVFGMPADLVAEVLVASTLAFVSANPGSPLKEIRFCNVAPSMSERFDTRLQDLA